MASSDWVALLQALGWPAFALITALIFRNSLIDLLSAIKRRMDSGAEIKLYSWTFGAVPSNLETPEKGALVAENHLALIHTSWRYPKKDAEFKRPMFCFHVAIQASDAVLNRVENVRYSLHPSYPKPIQIVDDRKSRFKLKELAWGESIVRAEVKIKDQIETIKLSRYINLTLTGPQI